MCKQVPYWYSYDNAYTCCDRQRNRVRLFSLSMSDIVLGNALNWGLIRTETLADGCERCDFRFKKGGNPRIFSKTPEVQATLERIRKKEAT